MCRPIECTVLPSSITAIMQLATIYLLGVIMVLCAYAGYTITASILEVTSSSVAPAMIQHLPLVNVACINGSLI